MMGSKSRVPTETYVERELIAQEPTGDRYVYRLCWEGTVIASTEVMVPSGASVADVDSTGVSWLLRALSPC